MYRRQMSAEDAAEFGMTAEEAAGPPVGVFSDNWLAVSVFCAIEGQWRMGPRGPYALDYNVLFHKLDRMGLDRAAYDELEGEVQVLEAAALATMRRNQG